MQYTQGRLLPKLTQEGFKVFDIPPPILAKLQNKLNSGLQQSGLLGLSKSGLQTHKSGLDHSPLPEEQQLQAVYGPRPRIAQMGNLGMEAGEVLKGMHEEWAGVKLELSFSYGSRVYGPNNTLAMHRDGAGTQVISSVLHLAHKYCEGEKKQGFFDRFMEKDSKESKGWALQIEDHEGQLREVVLQEGQMLIYESAKLAHGRLRPLQGDYYASLFLHYTPQDRDLWPYTVEEVVAAVPPHWSEGIKFAHGSRWAGQAITVDSRVADGAPPRDDEAAVAAAALAAVAAEAAAAAAAAEDVQDITIPDIKIPVWEVWNGEPWKPTFQEEHPSYRSAMEQREREIMELQGQDERWTNWVDFTQQRMLPTFTELGFEVVQIPPHVFERLSREVGAAVAQLSTLCEEQDIKNSIYGPFSPKFSDLGSTAAWVSAELKTLHEEWAGVELEITGAYGVRLYGENASMAMHNDKIGSHVISSIVHIAHEYFDDNHPWPIEIEDHSGNLHAVNLEPGQMLFYESAKCLHGRRSLLRGRYYGSVFVHYRPVDRGIWTYAPEDVTKNVPSHWSQGVSERYGSRWSGSGITTDSRAAGGAPPRTLLNPRPAFDMSEVFSADFHVRENAKAAADKARNAQMLQQGNLGMEQGNLEREEGNQGDEL